MGDDASVDSLIRCCVCHDIANEPVTHPCLHSCCKACIGAIAAATAASSDGRGSPLVTCPRCGATTRAASLRPNDLIAAFAAASTVAAIDTRSAVVSCEASPPCIVCRDEDGVVNPAEFECAQCAGPLCADCLRWHNKFKRQHTVVPLADRGVQPRGGSSGARSSGARSSSDRLLPAVSWAVRCPAHDRPCEAFCFTCSRLTCSDCVGSECGLHDVATLASQRIGDYVGRIERSISASLGYVDGSVQAALSLYDDDGGGGLEVALAADMRRLLVRKRAALDCVSRAHERAEQLLCQAYVDLACRAPERRTSAVRVGEQSRHVRSYAKLLLGTSEQSAGAVAMLSSKGAGGGGGSSSSHHRAIVLDQHALVLSCVGALLQEADEIARVAAGIVSDDVDRADVAGVVGGSCKKEQQDAEVERLVHKWLPHSASAAEGAQGQPTGLPQDSQQQVEVDRSGDCQRDPPPTTAAGRSTSVQPGHVTAAAVAATVAAAAEGQAYTARPPVTSAANPERLESAALVATTPRPQPGADAVTGIMASFRVTTEAAGDAGRLGAEAAAPPAAAATEQQEQERWQLLLCCSCSQLAVDPVLLGCLHSCCKRCVETVSMAVSPEGSGPASEGQQWRRHIATCPLCGVGWDVAALKPNGFVAALAHAAAAERKGGGATSPPLCEPCLDDRSRVEAKRSCVNCRKRFCDACLVWHNKFTSGSHELMPATHRFDDGGGGDSSASPLPECAKHSSKCDVFCVDCDRLRCMACSAPCLDKKHDIAIVGGQRADELARVASGSLRAASDGVGERAAAKLVQSRGGVDDLDEQGRRRLLREVREADDLRRLRESSRSLRDAVEAALRRAEADVAAAHELKAGGDDARRRLGVRVRTAQSYCGALLLHQSSSLGRASVLEQQRTVTACLESLRAELDQLPACVEEFVNVTDGRRRDETLEDIVRDWLGCPKLTRTVGVSAATPAVKAEQNEMDRTSAENFIFNEIAIDGFGGDGADAQQSQHQHQLVARFGSAACSFNADDDCRDVAFTPDGHILLAALKKGMKEYDCSGSEVACDPPLRPAAELSHWHPPLTEEGRDDCVSTLHAYDDGLVVVGLINSQSVALLRRNGASAAAPWLEEQRFMLRTGPWRLSGHGDLLVVSGARDVVSKKSRHWSPGPYIDLMRVGDGHQLLSTTLEYDVQGVALTARTIVALSNDLQQLTPGGGGAGSARGHRCYVIDAYTHTGELLWRSDSDNASDVCAPSAGSVLYLAQLHSDRVRAVSHVDGRHLDDAVSSGLHRLWSPICVSLRASGASGGRPAALAVLSAGDTVNVYPIEYDR